MHSKHVQPARHLTSAGTHSLGILAPASRRRIFFLSPANASGLRASLILGDSARSDLARRLRGEGATLAEVFSFISGLYFRGKLAYARAYADPPPGILGVAVITASGGLVSPDKLFTIEQLREISAVAIEAEEPRYRIPLERDAHLLCDQMGSDCEVVLLGSIATPKYVQPLVSIFGERLVFPVEFVGRGDMSRGGLMLRCTREGTQLKYVPVVESVRHGSRPPKLPPADTRSKRAVRRNRS
jgi:hypothetical protein